MALTLAGQRAGARSGSPPLAASEEDLATGTTYETDPQFTTTLVIGEGTTAWSRAAGIGFEDLEVSVAPTTP